MIQNIEICYEIELQNLLYGNDLSWYIFCNFDVLFDVIFMEQTNIIDVLQLELEIWFCIQKGIIKYEQILWH